MVEIPWGPVPSLYKTLLVDCAADTIACWGELEQAPHLSYCCAKSSLYIRAVRPSGIQFGPTKGPIKRETRKRQTG